jgi:hypothetical protein
MSICPWEAIDAFVTPGEFARFERWLADQINDGEAIEVEPKPGPQNLYWKQRWVKHVDSGEVWVLAYPDPPFRGEFKKLG